jgi:hypothetical protein
MKKFILLCMGIVFTVNIMAESVVIAIPAKPGGLANIQAELLKSSLNDQGINADIKFMGNCQAAAKLMSEDTPVMTILATHIAADKTCGFKDIDRTQFLGYLQRQGISVCYKKNRADLGWAHFQNPVNTKTVLTMGFWKTFTESWSRDLGIEHTRIITLSQSNDIHAQTFLNEMDYFVLDNSYVAKNRDRLTCMFTSAVAPLDSVPTLSSLVGTRVKWPEVYVSHVLVTNSVKHAPQYRIWLHHVLKSDRWQNYIRTSGVEMVNLDEVQQYQFYQKQLSIFAK